MYHVQEEDAMSARSASRCGVKYGICIGLRSNSNIQNTGYKYGILMGRAAY